MKHTIRKYYLFQLVVCFIWCFILINTIGFINNIDKRAASQLILISFVGSLIFSALNGITNALNFTFVRLNDKFIAFYIPIIFWGLPSIYVLVSIFTSQKLQTTDWFLFAIYTEPVLYNLKAMTLADRVRLDKVDD